jgi:hypothetical protein
MTRRPGPPEDPQAQDRMKWILAQRTANFVPKTSVDKKLIEAGHLKPTERLDVSSGEIIAPSNEGAKADVTPFVQLPMGYDPKADPHALEWLTPVKDCQISSGGAYEVRARRSSGGWTFVAYRGLDVLGEPQATAQAARDIALAHYREACGVPL